MNDSTMPYSIYCIENDDCYYVGSARNGNTPENRFNNHAKGIGGATRLWEVMQSGVPMTQRILESGETRTSLDVFVAEEGWIHYLVASDARECLNVNLFPAHAYSPQVDEPRTHCRNGHEYTAENTEWVISGDRPAVRRCVQCKKDRQYRFARSRGQKERATITHCPQGHEYTPDNIIWHYRDEQGYSPVRSCKECDRIRKSKRVRKLPAPPATSATTKEIRVWAQSQGLRAAPTGGPLAFSVIQAYVDAHT